MESWLWEQIPCHTRESNPCQYCTWRSGPTLYWHQVNTPVFTSLSFPTTSGVVFRYLSGSTGGPWSWWTRPVGRPQSRFSFFKLSGSSIRCEQSMARRCPSLGSNHRKVSFRSVPSTMEIIGILTERTTPAIIITLMLMVTVVKLTEAAAKIKERKTFNSVCTWFTHSAMIDRSVCPSSSDKLNFKWNKSFIIKC